ncbi:MAG TPA: flagellar protein FlaG [Armatimonadota bacterium]|jgi:uncharacterized FlaG/YvyC family protein
MRIDAVGLGVDVAARPPNTEVAPNRQAAQPAPVQPASGGGGRDERAQADKAAQAREVDRYESAKDAAPSLETRISVDQTTHETYVQVVDSAKQEVVVELPSEKIRLLSESLAEAAGKKLDVKA